MGRGCPVSRKQINTKHLDGPLPLFLVVIVDGVNNLLLSVFHDLPDRSADHVTGRQRSDLYAVTFTCVTMSNIQGRLTYSATLQQSMQIPNRQQVHEYLRNRYCRCKELMLRQTKGCWNYGTFTHFSAANWKNWLNIPRRITRMAELK